MNDFSIIIVSYNTCRLLEQCLASIEQHAGPNTRVIVVDNASADGSMAMVEKKFPWVKGIANEKNLGFAKANNIALPHCQGRYICFLNPDTAIFDDTIENARAYMAREQAVGLAGVRLLNPDGTHQQSVETTYPRQRFDKQQKKRFAALKGDIAWVSGACMIARREVIAKVGGLDEDFFLYAEEIDLCLRIRKAGWAIGYIDDARVTHWAGQSEKPNLPVTVWEKKYNAELLFMKKHYSQAALRSSIRANRRQAVYRVITLGLTLPWVSGPKKKIMQNKLDTYRCLLRMTKGSGGP